MSEQQHTHAVFPSPGRAESPDGTQTMMTFSDSCSMSTADQSTIATANTNSKYYENNSLLPRGEEEVENDGEEEEDSLMNEGPRRLNISSSSSNHHTTTDDAIESGNWEQVAASAARSPTTCALAP